MIIVSQKPKRHRSCRDTTSSWGNWQSIGGLPVSDCRLHSQHGGADAIVQVPRVRQTPTTTTDGFAENHTAKRRART